MNRSNQRQIGLLVLVFGCVSLLYSGLAYGYRYTMVGISGTAVVYPLGQYYPIPLVVGIVLLVAGLGVYWKSRQDQP